MTLLYISLLILIIVTFKIYLKLSTGWCKSQKCLVGKTAIVTGANTGIGFETAKDFAKRGAKVILACRDQKKAEEARLQIIAETDNHNVFVKVIDLSSFDSVRTFAKDINTNEDRLDILVNNAGVAPLVDEKTTDGFYLGMQVNYLSMFLLTNLLLGLMHRTVSARIVNVSSILARFAFNFRTNQIYDFYEPFVLYCRTKLCIILFTQELAKKLENTKVTSYSLHPGIVETDIFRYCEKGYWLVFAPLKNWFSKTSVEGAQTTIFCSVEKGLEKFSGRHFEDCGKVSDYHTARRRGISSKLWGITEKIVNLSDEENFFINNKN